MKITVVSPGTHFQDTDLLQQAQKKGHRLEFVQLTHLQMPLTTSVLDESDVVYWRIGNPRIREISALYCRQKGIPFVNPGYHTHPLLGYKSYQSYINALDGIQIPKTFLVSQKTSVNQLNSITQALGFPVIIKRLIGAKGASVWKANDLQQLQQIVEKEALRECLLQEDIPNDGDYRVIIVGGNPIGAFKRIPLQGEFKANISLGGHGEVVSDEQTLKTLMVLASKAAQNLNISIAGIDFIRHQDTGEFYLIETNSIPQWEGFTKTTGINVAEKIVEYLEQIARN